MNNSTTSLRVLFFGTPEFAAVGLQALLDTPQVSVVGVITQPDRPAGRGGNLVGSPVKNLASSLSIPLFQPSNLRKDDSGFFEFLKSVGPVDVGVVIAFGQILPQKILDVPRAGCVNVHGSLLPRWRGAAPIQRAIMEGDEQTGVGLMKMDAGLDTGGVYIQSSVPITHFDTFQTIHDKLAKIGGELLREHISEISSGKLTAHPQPAEGITYAKKIENQEALIIWDSSVSVVLRHIHGLSPWPGAYSTLNGKRIKIYRAALAQQGNAFASPGTVIEATSRSLSVATKNGALALLEVQLEGKKRIGIDEFLKGFPLEKGVRFGT